MTARPLSKRMVFVRAVIVGVFAISLAAITCVAQSPKPEASGSRTAQAPPTPDQEKLLKSTEAFVRELFAWGPDFNVKLGPLRPAIATDFYVVPLELTVKDQSDSGEVYVSKDGKTFMQGDMYDMAADPFAANRAKLHAEGNPSQGPADAVVTLVEFSDFQCPHCRELHENLKTIETRYPQVRVVYKDFPLNSIHPWAQTAAIGGRCAFQQSPEGFWKVHNLIFDNQDLISTENAWDKLADFAVQAGLKVDAFKACVASPEAQKAVDANRADGVALGVNSTPTVYVNGRAVVGGNPETIMQYIEFETAAKSAAKK